MVDAAARRRFARDELLPVREQLARQWEELMTIQLRLVSTPGELGTVANLEQHVRSHNGILAERDPELTAALGAPLPDTVRPTRRYLGEPKLIIPTARTVADEGEALRIRAIVLSNAPSPRLEPRVRRMGSGPWRTIEPTHLGRGVFEFTLPPITAGGLEYTVTAETGDGARLHWPARDDGTGQTVTALPTGP
jgi:hypothetical protein